MHSCRRDVAIRTRFYDDYLLEACAAGCRQVVILAAGLDARAFRLDWPAETRVFELDLPELFVFKGRPFCASNTRRRTVYAASYPLTFVMIGPPR